MTRAIRFLGSFSTPAALFALVITIGACLPSTLSGQWTSGNAGSIYYNGSVGVGTGGAPAATFHVAGKTILGGSTSTTGPYGLSIADTTSDYTPFSANWNYSLLLNAGGTSSIGFHHASNSVGSIRYNSRLFTIGGDDGWGTANVSMPGSLAVGTPGVPTGPVVNLNVQPGGAIRVGTAYISGGGGYANFASNAWYDGGRWNIPLNNARAGLWQFDATNPDQLYFFQTQTPGGADFAPRMMIASGGNVGIGTTSPAYKLSVNGPILAKEVIVSTSWSDYVFEPTYRLTPLSQVAVYIRENHHLPDMPSAAEVQEKGIGLGEIQSKLLAKIEGLTLHAIRLEEQNQALQERIKRLEERR